MSDEYHIEISDGQEGDVAKIKVPSEVVWKSVAAALVTSAFFWGRASAMALGIIVGFPAVLAVAGKHHIGYHSRA